MLSWKWTTTIGLASMMTGLSARAPLTSSPKARLLVMSPLVNFIGLFDVVWIVFEYTGLPEGSRHITLCRSSQILTKKVQPF
jgi:hypothetical protein